MPAMPRRPKFLSALGMIILLFVPNHDLSLKIHKGLSVSDATNMALHNSN